MRKRTWIGIFLGAAAAAMGCASGRGAAQRAVLEGQGQAPSRADSLTPAAWEIAWPDVSEETYEVRTGVVAARKQGLSHSGLVLLQPSFQTLGGIGGGIAAGYGVSDHFDLLFNLGVTSLRVGAAVAPGVTFRFPLVFLRDGVIKPFFEVMLLTGVLPNPVGAFFAFAGGPGVQFDLDRNFGILLGLDFGGIIDFGAQASQGFAVSFNLGFQGRF